ncbi:hypothetical protein RJT34_30388 [Clitoria ternatea]|uniref:Uncharacterized protein n=1 Tax=Clitoria ternatea TaxID=43366 RepID=A0AAN9I1X6_CLITE
MTSCSLCKEENIKHLIQLLYGSIILSCHHNYATMSPTIVMLCVPHQCLLLARRKGKVKGVGAWQRLLVGKGAKENVRRKGKIRRGARLLSSVEFRIYRVRAKVIQKHKGTINLQDPQFLSSYISIAISQLLHLNPQIRFGEFPNSSLSSIL